MRESFFSFLLLVPLALYGEKTSADVFVPAYDRIMLAVVQRDEAALRKLVSEGININAQNPSGQTALCTALSRHDSEGYRMLFNQGATVHTPCIRQIPSQTLSSFYSVHPELGRYENGRILVPNVIKATSSNSPSWIGGLPWPHIGEILLAGAAVGVVASVGGGGSSKGGAGGGGYPSNLFNPVKDVDVTLNNFPNLGHYWSESRVFNTEEEVNTYKRGYTNKIWDDAGSTKYAWEYNGGGSYTGDYWDAKEQKRKYTLVNQTAFLPMINAGAAYARGYTGYVVDRTDVNNPVITPKKVKVAVIDSGLELGNYAHDQLANNISSEVDDTPEDFNQKYGRLNFSYGPCSKNNSTNCWAFYGGDSYLVKDITQQHGTESDNYSPLLSTIPGPNTYTEVYTGLGTRDAWNLYSMGYAPVCLGDNRSNCLTAEVSTYDFDHNPVTYEVTYYPEGWVEDGGTAGNTIKYIVKKELWSEYVYKYGSQGYVYNLQDTTPGLLFESETSSDSMWSSQSHGTHISGVLAAVQDDKAMSGVAPNAEIIPVRADFQMQQILNHLTDVITKTDAQVVNLSIGTDEYISSSGVRNKTIWESIPQNVRNGYEAAAQKEKDGKASPVVLVFSAGNESKSQPHSYTVAPLVGDSDDIKTNYANSIYKNLLISVVSVDENRKLASYSNSCGASSMYCLSAPGGTQENPIVSTALGNKFAASSGTSQAAPIVSGSVALLMGAFPFLKPQEVVQILFETASYIEPIKDEEKGIDEIAAYNKKAYIEAGHSAEEAVPADFDAYSKNTVEGEYNAIYGHGMVDLDAATDPIGLPKINFGTAASSGLAIDINSTNLIIPASLQHTLSVLPKNIVVLDKYTRPYEMPTARFVSTEKRTDSLKRSFQSFMAMDETVVSANDNLSFGFTEAPSDSVGLPTGSMTMQMKPSSNLSVRMGYTQDTKSFGGTYVKRILQNPLINMRQSWGSDMAWNLAGNWSLTGGFQYGQNGFIDSDTIDQMSDKPMMKVFQTGVRYAYKKSVVFDISFGQMDEEESLLGLRGDGAFKTDGNKTSFVSVGATIVPFDKWQLSASYTYGMTTANATETLMKFSRLTSDAFALTALYQPNEQSSFGFKMASPIRVRSGTVTFDLPTARDMYEDRLYRTQFTSDMKPEAREYDLSLFFTNQLKEELMLAGEAGVRLHPEHQKEAKPDWQTLLKVNWRW